MIQASSAYIAGCLCAVTAGAFLATQSGINSTLGSLTGRSFASVVSFAVGLGALLVFLLIDVYGLGNKGPDRQSVKAAPWWAWTGGLLGAFYVAVVIIFVRTLGAGTLMAIFVSAQLSTAVALDALGWVGFRRRPLHWARIAGLLLMIGGVALVTYFDGSRGMRGAFAPPPNTGSGGRVEVEGAKGDSDPLLLGSTRSGEAGFGALPARAVAERQEAAEDADSRGLLLPEAGRLEAGQEAEEGSGGGDVELARGRRGDSLPSG